MSRQIAPGKERITAHHLLPQIENLQQAGRSCQSPSLFPTATCIKINPSAGK